MKVRRAWLIAAIGALGLVALARAKASDPNVLWRIVHTRCVAHFKQSGSPAPCARVDLRHGYAVLKDLRGAEQFLVIPTARVSGIEDPKILAPGAPNYWAEAWSARRFIDARIGRSPPRDDFALAVNSRFARSQNQLHIHVDCVRESVRRILRANQGGIGPRWSSLPVDLAGHRWRAVRIERKRLGALNPFKLLADEVPGARAHMGEQTLVVVGMRFRGGKPGFVVVNDSADLARMDRGSGEQLLDHQCTLLQRR